MEVKKKIFIKARERVDSTILTANSTGADSADNQPKSAFSAFMLEDEEEDDVEDETQSKSIDSSKINENEDKNDNQEIIFTW